MRIAFFDSGIGGLTVLSEALRMLPGEEYLYYADTDHVPYGDKPKEAVRQYVCAAAGFIARQGVKALVVACNTATSIGIEELRSRYSFPVIGMEPAVKPAVEHNSGRRVLVLATALTLREEKFQHLVSRVDAAGIVDTLAFPELVQFAERGIFDEPVILSCLKEKLASLDLRQYGTVVLGCTHFPFYRRAIAGLFPAGVALIDGNAGTVRHLRNILASRNLLSALDEPRPPLFYFSGRRELDDSRCRRYLELAFEQSRPDR